MQMKRIILAIVLCALIANSNAQAQQGADAQWLVQLPGQTACSILYFGTTAPAIGTDPRFPAGSLAAQFVTQDGDTNLRDYSINSNGALLHNGFANPLSVRAAIQADTNISAQGQIAIASLGWMLNDYVKPGGAAVVQAEWAKIAASGQISASDVTEIQNVCAANGMPLVAQ